MYKLQPGGKFIITDTSNSSIEAAKSEMSLVKTPSIVPQRSNVSMDKMANIRAKAATSDVTRIAPMFNDPRYTSSTLAIPPDSRTLHGLYRFFSETDPIVGASIKMLAEMPLSDLKLGQCEDSGIQQHFEDMWDRINGFKLLSDISLEYFEIGDVFCMLPETSVFTKEGFKSIKDIIKGDLVLTDNGKFENVEKAWPREVDENIYKIIPWKINLFKGCTGNHKIMTDRGWIEAKDIKAGDYVQIALPQRKIKDVEYIDLEIRREVKSIFQQSNDLTKKDRFITWLENLTEPIEMSYKELAKIINSNKQCIANCIAVIEKNGGKVKRKRIHKKELVSPSNKTGEITVWYGINFGGKTREQILKGVTKRYFKSNINRVNVNNEFMYLLGYWFGDGCLFEEKRLDKYSMRWAAFNICFGDKYKYIYDYLCEVFPKIFGISVDKTTRYYKSEGIGCPHNLVVRNHLFCEWWGSQFGGKCENKHIPDWIINLPNEKLKYFLGGLIDSDGCITRNGVIFSGKNKTLMTQIFQIGLLLGYPFGINCREGGKKVKLPTGDFFILNDMYTVAFLDRVKSVELMNYSKKSKESFKSEKKSQARERLKFENGKWYAEVRKIESEPYKGQVWDIQVANTHNFSAEGIIVHNCFGAWNSVDYMWDQFAVLNPDYVKVESTWVNQRPLIKLVPDETLRRIVQTKTPKFIYQQLPPEIIRNVLFNQEIPLDPNNVFHIAHAKRPYEQRGKSIIKRILKTLMLEDRFNQANFALATRHAVPMMLVKVGDAQTGWIPDETELNAVREMMASFELDPNFSIIWHYGINIEHVGSNGKMLPVGPELDRIYRLKFIGLGVHEQLLAGQGGSYSTIEDHLVVYRKDGDDSRLIESFKEMWDKIDKPINIEHGCQTKDVSDLNISTISLDSEGLQKWTSIKKIIRHKLDKNDKLLDVRTNNSVITSTTGHGFIWLNPETWVCEEVSASKLQETPNCTLVDILNLEKFGKAYSEIWCHPLTPELAYFLGVWNADGCLGIKNGYDLQFSNKNIKLLEHIKQMVSSLPFKRIEDRVRPSTGVHSLYMHWANLKYDLLEFYGLSFESSKSMTKTGRERIPEEILFNIDSDIVGAYVAGELDGDGCVHQSDNQSGGQVMFTSASKRFLLELAFLLRRFGIISNPLFDNTNVQDTEDCKGTTRFNVTMKVYNLFISDQKSFKNLYDLLERWMGVDYKKEKLYKLSIKGHREINRNMYINKMKKRDSYLINRQRVLDKKEYTEFEKTQAQRFDTVRVNSIKDSNKTSEYVYDLELSENPHTYMVCGEGWLLNHNSQAYVNMEVQRQRYLNYQLKIENFVHTGIFKTTSDLCGFYRVKNAIASYSGVKSYKYGKQDNLIQKIGEQFKTLRDIQDNREFKSFIQVKADEIQQQQQRQIRDYVYPKLDWGSLSASTDENLKNFIKWLSEKRPYLVDDATLARLARLDRDTQEKAWMEDLRRKQKRLLNVSKEGLLPFMQDKTKGGAGAVDFGGIGDIGIGGGGPLGDEGPEGGALGIGGGEAPIGAGGPPETAGGTEPPVGMSSLIDQLNREVLGEVVGDDVTISNENKGLLNAKKVENIALLRTIDGTGQ